MAQNRAYCPRCERRLPLTAFPRRTDGDRSHVCVGCRPAFGGVVVPVTERGCPTCGRVFPLAAFPTRSNGDVHRRCADCTAQIRADAGSKKRGPKPSAALERRLANLRRYGFVS